MVRDVVEQVDHVGIVNTILMDCLHHGIKTVKSLDTSTMMLPELEAQVIAENVIWAALPAVGANLNKEERKVVMRNHDMYIEGLVENYFGGEDYTLIYVTESRHDTETKQDADDGKEYFMESEVPLVSHGELAKRALGTLKNSTSSSNQTIVDGPLFDKYQFFSPGTCMNVSVVSRALVVVTEGLYCFRELLLTQLARYLYGPFCRLYSSITDVCRHLCTVKSTSHLCSLRQGTGSISWKEVVMYSIDISRFGSGNSY